MCKTKSDIHIIHEVFHIINISFSTHPVEKIARILPCGNRWTKFSFFHTEL